MVGPSQSFGGQIDANGWDLAGFNHCASGVLRLGIFTPSMDPSREAGYCDKHVCLSVCLCDSRDSREHISGTTRPNCRPNRLSVHVACGCGSILYWYRCSMFRTSGYVDDAMFARKLIGQTKATEVGR